MTYQLLSRQGTESPYLAHTHKKKTKKKHAALESESCCIKIVETLYILSTAIAYLCVIDANHFLNDPHSDKNAIMSGVLIA